MVKAIAATPSNYCDPKYVDANFIKQYETTGCDFKTQPPVKNLKINAITINRDMAVVSESAPLGAGSKPGTVTLKKQGGVWKVDYAIQLD